MRLKNLTTIICLALSPFHEGFTQEIQYGVRPYYLIDAMKNGPLKSKLESCVGRAPQRTSFSIVHRGAPS